jgi:hypothetical protein
VVFLALSIVVQVALIVHVLRTGRSMYWVFIIAFLPPVGPLAYLIVELLPEWSGSVRAQKALKGVRRTIDPGGDLRRRQRQHRLSGSVDATRHLAGELTGSGHFDEAIEHYEAALTGLYEHDPVLLLGLAEAQFGKSEFARAKETLERFAEHNPDYRSPEGHLLYARALEECGELDDAEKEYHDVSAYFAGAEAKVRHARLLEKLQQEDEALNRYEDVLASAELGPRHYRRAQKRWISEAREGVRRLQG